MSNADTEKHEAAIRKMARLDAESHDGTPPPWDVAFEVWSDFWADGELDDDDREVHAAITALGEVHAQEIYEDEGEKIVDLSVCSQCGTPAHPSETDDLDRCRRCREQPDRIDAALTRLATHTPGAVNYPTIDDGTALARAIYDDIVATYDRAIDLARIALVRIGREPSVVAVEAARSAMSLHALDLAAALGNGILPLDLGDHAIAFALRLTQLHLEGSKP